MNKSTKIRLVLLTPLFVIVAHHLAMLPHEYAHSFTAWILGYKSNPFALNYGGMDWLNLLFLSQMDEHVDYDLLFSQGLGGDVAVIAAAGMVIGNGVMFVLSLWWMAKKSVQQRPYLFYFLLLFNLMNLGNFWDYIPMRTFSHRGDVAHFATGLGLSPWWVYVLGGYGVVFLSWYFFARTLVAAYGYLKMESTCSKASLMTLCVVILFGYFGMAGFGHDCISHFLSCTSVALIPLMIFLCWPARLHQS